MKKHHAECSCGKVSVTAFQDPLRVSICHCYACQRRTGSAFGVQARFSEQDVTIQGEAKSYVRKADSGNEIMFYFCGNCGSTVYYCFAAIPGAIIIPVGLFANSQFPAPRMSIYEDRKHWWVRFDCELEHMD